MKKGKTRQRESTSRRMVFKRSNLTKIDQLDKAFQPQAGKNGLLWIDAFDERLALRGLAWPKENRRRKNFRRLPARADPDLPAAVVTLAHGSG